MGKSLGYAITWADFRITLYPSSKSHQRDHVHHRNCHRSSGNNATMMLIRWLFFGTSALIDRQVLADILTIFRTEYDPRSPSIGHHSPVWSYRKTYAFVANRTNTHLYQIQLSTTHYIMLLLVLMYHYNTFPLENTRLNNGGLV